jgi:hypothetical protein
VRHLSPKLVLAFALLLAMPAFELGEVVRADYLAVQDVSQPAANHTVDPVACVLNNQSSNTFTSPSLPSIVAEVERPGRAEQPALDHRRSAESLKPNGQAPSKPEESVRPVIPPRIEVDARLRAGFSEAFLLGQSSTTRRLAWMFGQQYNSNEENPPDPLPPNRGGSEQLPATIADTLGLQPTAVFPLFLDDSFSLPPPRGSGLWRPPRN